jgi:four helix bundle protein
MYGLRIYPVIIEVLRLLRPLIALVARHDRDLTDQLRRAAASIALNVAEGSGSSGGTRQQRYRTALGSARETGACLDVALALGYVEKVDPDVLHKLDIVRATLARLVR